VEAVRQCFKRILGYLFRCLAELAVEVRMVVRIHAALERFGVVGAIKEPRCNTQSADAITDSPGRTDFIRLANHAVSPAPQSALAELGQNLQQESQRLPIAHGRSRPKENGAPTPAAHRECWPVVEPSAKNANVEPRQRRQTAVNLIHAGCRRLTQATKQRLRLHLTSPKQREGKNENCPPSLMRHCQRGAVWSFRSVGLPRLLLLA
jgi:hypothetical protein